MYYLAQLFASFFIIFSNLLLMIHTCKSDKAIPKYVVFLQWCGALSWSVYSILDKHYFLLSSSFANLLVHSITFILLYNKKNTSKIVFSNSDTLLPQFPPSSL